MKGQLQAGDRPEFITIQDPALSPSPNLTNDPEELVKDNHLAS